MRASLIAALIALVGCGQTPEGNPTLGFLQGYRDTSVPIGSKADLDVERYLGLWYEIARFPVPFEAGCVGVTAEYGAIAPGEISVRNTCRNADGSIRATIEGAARIVGPGRLEVRFSGVPFVRGDYWVLWVDEGYRTAVVGAPGGRSGWILNRTPTISPDRLAAAREVLDFNGYDLTRLEMVPQEVNLPQESR